MDKYKSPALRIFIAEVLGLVSVVGIFLGIWLPPFRWRLIFTSLFSIFLAFILAIVDKKQEEKFNKKEVKPK